MAKFHGTIGFAIQGKTSPGVWEDQITPREYSGDLLTSKMRVQNSDDLNDNLVISNRISIVADPFANDNYQSIRYVEYMGAKWKVTDIEIQRPRLILTMGGVYNG